MKIIKNYKQFTKYFENIQVVQQDQVKPGDQMFGYEDDYIETDIDIDEIKDEAEKEIPDAQRRGVIIRGEYQPSANEILAPETEPIKISTGFFQRGTIRYKLTPGETKESVAAKYHISLADLEAANKPQRGGVTATRTNANELKIPVIIYTATPSTQTGGNGN